MLTAVVVVIAGFAYVAAWVYALYGAHLVMKPHSESSD